MFGSLRFLLALLVVLSHVQMPAPWGLNVGVSAVAVFYMLAGYVVSYLLSDVFTGHNNVFSFYRDRLWRIFPQYLFALIFASLLWLFIKPPSDFLSVSPTWLDWLSNVFIVPLNFYMFSGQDAFTLIPPAWSLGAEIQFYIIAPFLLLYPPIGALLLALSIGVFIFSQVGFLDSDIYGYRLLIGVLFIFYIGVLIHRKQQLYVWSIATVGAIYSFYLISQSIHTYFLREIALGITIGTLVITLLSRVVLLNTALKLTDAWLGRLSYGLFLFHFPMIWLVQYVLSNTLNWLVLLSYVILGSILMAYIGSRWIERYFWSRYR